MKTTINLPDDLLAEAKAVAALRRTTLRAVIEHALRRELMCSDSSRSESDQWTVNEFGFPVLGKADPDKVVTSEEIYRLLEEEG